MTERKKVPHYTVNEKYLRYVNPIWKEYVVGNSFYFKNGDVDSKELYPLWFYNPSPDIETFTDLVKEHFQDFLLLTGQCDSLDKVLCSFKITGDLNKECHEYTYGIVSGDLNTNTVRLIDKDRFNFSVYSPKKIYLNELAIYTGESEKYVYLKYDTYSYYQTKGFLFRKKKQQRTLLFNKVTQQFVQLINGAPNFHKILNYRGNKIFENLVCKYLDTPFNSLILHKLSGSYVSTVNGFIKNQKYFLEIFHNADTLDALHSNLSKNHKASIKYHYNKHGTKQARQVLFKTKNKKLMSVFSKINTAHAFMLVLEVHYTLIEQNNEEYLNLDPNLLVSFYSTILNNSNKICSSFYLVFKELINYMSYLDKKILSLNYIFKKSIQLLEKEDENRLAVFHDYFIYLKDTVRILLDFPQAGRDLNIKTLQSVNIRYVHDLLVKHTNRMSKPNKQIPLTHKEIQTCRVQGDFTLLPVHDRHTLMDIGTDMGICVGSYFNEAFNKSLTIYQVYQHGLPVFCIEANGKNLVQGKLSRNNRLSSLDLPLAKFINEWKEEHNFNFSNKTDFAIFTEKENPSLIRLEENVL